MALCLLVHKLGTEVAFQSKLVVVFPELEGGQLFESTKRFLVINFIYFESANIVSFPIRCKWDDTWILLDWWTTKKKHLFRLGKYRQENDCFCKFDLSPLFHDNNLKLYTLTQHVLHKENWMSLVSDSGFVSNILALKDMHRKCQRVKANFKTYWFKISRNL